MDKSPLFQIVKSWSKEKSLSTKIFYGLIASVCIFFVLKAFVPSIQRICIKQFHLRSASFFQWALLQPLPWMYSYANEVCWTDNINPKACLDFHERAYPRFHTWLNHYPLRFVTFTYQRPNFVLTETDQYIHLKSRYKNQELTTTYKIIVNPDNLYLKPLESTSIK